MPGPLTLHEKPENKLLADTNGGITPGQIDYDNLAVALFSAQIAR